MENNLSSKIFEAFNASSEQVGKLSEKFDAYKQQYDKDTKDLGEIQKNLTTVNHTLWGTDKNKQGGVSKSIDDLESTMKNQEKLNKTKFEGLEKIINQGRGMILLLVAFSFLVSLASGIASLIIFFK